MDRQPNSPAHATPKASCSTLHPAALDTFIAKTAKLEGVKCIVAEQIEGEQTIRVTTFVDPLTDETHTVLYLYEAELIAACQNQPFEFCLVEAGAGELTTPKPSPNSRLFILWGGL